MPSTRSLRARSILTRTTRVALPSGGATLIFVSAGAILAPDAETRDFTTPAEPLDRANDHLLDTPLPPEDAACQRVGPARFPPRSDER